MGFNLGFKGLNWLSVEMLHLLWSSAETFCHSCAMIGKVDTGCAVFLLELLCEVRGPEHGAVTVFTEISDLHGCKQHEHLHMPAVLPQKKSPCSWMFWIYENISHRCVSYPLDQCGLTSSRGQHIILYFFPFCFFWQ